MAQASRFTHYSLLVIVDVIVVSAVAALAYFLRFGNVDPVPAPETQLPLVALLIPVGWIVTLALFGAYALSHLQNGPNEFRRVGTGTAFYAGAIGIACYLFLYPLSRSFFIITFALGAPALLVLRFARRKLLNRLRTKGLFLYPVVVAGSPSHIDEIARVLRREKWLGYDIIGVVTPAPVTETPGGLPVLGTVAEVVDLVQAKRVDAVIFAEGSFPDSQHFKRMAWELEDRDTHMIVVPALTDVSSGRLAARPVAGLPLVHVDRPQAVAASRWVKRAFDIVGSSLLILASLPLIAAVALAIKLEDGGPVFFKQVRVGRRGEEFECFKIRSMVTDAEARKSALAAQDEGAGVLFKIRKDPRITKVGAFIRRFSIDEVPQFFNVLLGDMSLVGPRPALPREVAEYDLDAGRRLHVRPGLTGLWQVSGRSDLSWEETVRLDVYYVDNWSLMQDLHIIWRTAGAVLSSRGAY